MSKNKCSFHSLKFVLLFYKLKSPGLTWTTLVLNSLLLICIETQGVLNADRRNKTLENFQVPYRRANTEPPALWRNATSNLGTARAPLQMINIVVIL